MALKKKRRRILRRATIYPLTLIERLERRWLLSTSLLVFTVEPSTTNAAAVINSSVGIRVAVENFGGQVITSSTDTITLSISVNPGGGTLAGTTTASAVQGVANFSSVSINSPANGYVLSATDQTNSAVTAASSTLLNVDITSIAEGLIAFSKTGAGYTPGGSLVADSSGNLYGVTSLGGQNSTGTIYELSGPDYSVYTTLISFTGSSGNYPGDVPLAGLTIDSSGDLFGVTQYGTGNDGSVFELVGPSHTQFTQLASFTGTAGSEPGQSPQSNLVLGTDGNLYGTTYRGGAGNDGTVFELSGSNHTTFTSLISFTGATGTYPGQYANGLAVDSSGNLYGTTVDGGAAQQGNIYELSGSNHSSFSTVINFTGNGGSYIGADPEAALLIDGTGNLYGTTFAGGSGGNGTVFQVSGPSHTQFTSLVSFTAYAGPNWGAAPEAPLVFGLDGNLYGTTAAAGSLGINCGTVFKLSGAGHTTFNSLVSFTGSSGNAPGQLPQSGLLVDGSGNLIGTTETGGTYNYGSVFAVPPGGASQINVLSGSQTIPGLSGNGSEPGEYFSTINISSGASLLTTPSVAGHLVLQTNSLNIAGTNNIWTGKLDLTNNDLDVAGATLAKVANQVQRAYSGGTGGLWTGEGITSSTAANDTTHLTALGVIQNNQSGSALFTATNLFANTVPGAGDILVKYTYVGDANLDGKVDGSDYSLTDYGFAHKLTGWYDGDFNYDGVVNGSDYALIDNSFNRQGITLANQVARTATSKYTRIRLTAIFSEVSVSAQSPILPENFSTTTKSFAVGIFAQSDFPSNRMDFLFA